MRLLDRAVRQDHLTAVLKEIAVRVTNSLMGWSDQDLSWEPGPLRFYGVNFPSCVLREALINSPLVVEETYASINKQEEDSGYDVR